MVGDLIMLPVRVGVRATQLWLRAAEETVSLATNATTRLISMAAARSGGDGATATMPWPDTDRRDRPAPEPESAPPAARPPEAEREDPSATSAAAATATEPTSAPQPPPPPRRESEPVHVSEEPALVEEVAEPGAEDGAGPEIHVEEPWEGYARMNAKEIVYRLGQATAAELAAVQLYESTQRERQTILNAVQRELRRANGRSG